MELLGVDLPKKIIIGDNAIEKIGDFCRELDLKGSVNLFTGPHVMEIAGEKVIE